MADPSIAALQQTVNRYSGAAGFAPLTVDGIFGPKTRDGVLKALAWVAKAPIDASLRDAAATHVAQWSGQHDARLALIAIFLGNVANMLNLKGQTVPTSTAPSVPAGGGGSTTTDPGADPWAPKKPGVAASVGDFWRKMPTWQRVVFGVLVGFGLLLGVTKYRQRKQLPSGS